ncbi:MAG: class I SAM-dependent methyltransferase [Bradymonadales bacterium]|nr:class I SAM-dependent methyltransferase [Bradymonadales bacterium]
MTPEATSYDQLLYTTYAHHRSHPDRLATIGRLYGLQPPAVERCRVLELGCGSGGNLIPMAADLSESRFVGVDLSQRSIDLGNQAIADLGLDNIELKCRDIGAIAADLGSFDYILCHGLYSWVEAPLRERILEICAQQLSEQGIAFISYNTYPGWSQHEMLRQMLRYHTAKISHPANRVTLARQFLDALGSVARDESDLRAPFLRQELSHLESVEDSYLYHEYLLDNNQPVFLYQFVQQAGDHGLQYLGDAVPETMYPGNQQEPCLGFMLRSRDVVEAQQYQDFFTNCRFRYSLLCRQGLQIKLDLAPQIILDLFVRASFVPCPALGDLAMEQPVEITAENGNRATITGTPLKLALSLLSETEPRALPFRQLAAQVAHRMDDPAWPGALETPKQVSPAWRDLAAHLTRLYFGGLVQFHTRQAKVCNEIGERPMVSRVARVEAQARHTVTNGWHQAVLLDPPRWALIQVLDGTRTRAELVHWLEAFLKNNPAIGTQEAGGEAKPSQLLEAMLERFRRQALLVPG